MRTTTTSGDQAASLAIGAPHLHKDISNVHFGGLLRRLIQSGHAERSPKTREARNSGLLGFDQDKLCGVTQQLYDTIRFVLMRIDS